MSTDTKQSKCILEAKWLEPEWRRKNVNSHSRQERPQNNGCSLSMIPQTNGRGNTHKNRVGASLGPRWHKKQDAPTTKPPTNQTVGFNIETKRQTEAQRHTDTHRDKETERERDRDKKRETETKREGQRQRQRQRERDRDKERERETETKRERQRQRHRDKETKRQRERETETKRERLEAKRSCVNAERRHS